MPSTTCQAVHWPTGRLIYREGLVTTNSAGPRTTVELQASRKTLSGERDRLGFEDGMISSAAFCFRKHSGTAIDDGDRYRQIFEMEALPTSWKRVKRSGSSRKSGAHETPFIVVFSHRVSRVQASRQRSSAYWGRLFGQIPDPRLGRPGSVRVRLSGGKQLHVP